MSIANQVKLRELERRVAELEQKLAELMQEPKRDKLSLPKKS